MMTTIALLYPGDMGGAFAKLLISAGHRVISPLGERSEQTQKTAQSIGVEMRDDMASAVTDSDMVLSLVPSAVVDVAEQAIAACREQGAAPFFVDMNAKTPADAENLNTAFGSASLPFCNACIIGRASHLGDEGRIYASGPDTKPLEALFEGLLPVISLGDEIARASVFKMAFAGFNKTVAAALFETANTANAFGVTDSLFELIGHHLGGTLSDLGKLMPTYPRHILRRAEEMEALAVMLADAELPNEIALAAGATFRSLGNSGSWSATTTAPQLLELLSEIDYRQ
jgi:3-hydroxyisobutyrate dehydrogenase-like beta-hydroxyacid dehydrogenase